VGHGGGSLGAIRLRGSTLWMWAWPRGFCCTPWLPQRQGTLLDCEEDTGTCEERRKNCQERHTTNFEERHTKLLYHEHGHKKNGSQVILLLISLVALLDCLSRTARCWPVRQIVQKGKSSCSLWRCKEKAVNMATWIYLWCSIASVCSKAWLLNGLWDKWTLQFLYWGPSGLRAKIIDWVALFDPSHGIIQELEETLLVLTPAHTQALSFLNELQNKKIQKHC